jgi:hypothetical protein
MKSRSGFYVVASENGHFWHICSALSAQVIGDGDGDGGKEEVVDKKWIKSQLGFYVGFA